MNILLASTKKLLNAVAAIHQEHFETLRIKELLSTSQLNNEDMMILDDELKESWWQAHKEAFLEKIQRK